MGDERVVELLVAVERLVATHCDELDALNVFPVPDADTGRNVLATVRAARAAAEQARAGARGAQAIDGAVRGARGNAGVLTSQLLRGLLEAGGHGWPARLARADELARAAVAHPVEGSFLTAVRAAARAAAATEAATEADVLRAATAAAHAAVRATPTQLEVLARAGVVDSGARAAALVLEAVTAALAGEAPAPPTVEVPPGGPNVAGCVEDDAQFEVMYLLEPTDDEVLPHVRDGLDRIGGSVVVVAADRLVSVHVHTDDIGAALDVGLAHGRPHNVRVEDLHEGTRIAAARGQHPAHGSPRAVRTGVVVGADGDGVAQLAAATGATTLRLGASAPTPDDVVGAVARAGHEHVLLLPGAPDLGAVVATADLAGTDVTVVSAVDGPARLLAALAVLDPVAPDPELLSSIAAGVTEGAVVAAGDEWTVVVGDDVRTVPGDALDAFVALTERLDGDAELVSLLLGGDVGVVLRDAAAAVAGHRWPDADLDVVDVGLGRATFVVGLE